MKTISRFRSIAAAELLLISPAALFMTALFLRSVQSQQYEPAQTAQRIVMWYAARVHLGLWVFLMALPLAVLVLGGVTLLSAWHGDADLRQAARQTLAAWKERTAMIITAAATLSAGAILAIVAIHSLAT